MLSFQVVPIDVFHYIYELVWIDVITYVITPPSIDGSTQDPYGWSSVYRCLILYVLSYFCIVVYCRDY